MVLIQKKSENTSSVAADYLSSDIDTALTDNASVEPQDIPDIVDSSLHSEAEKKANAKRTTAGRQKKAKSKRAEKKKLSKEEKLEQKKAAQREAEMYQPHNRFFIETFKAVAFAIAFLKFALTESMCSRLWLEKLKVEERTFFDRRFFRESIADMVYSIPLKLTPKRKVKMFILIEHKSYNDFLVIFQLLYYTVQIMYKDLLEARKENRLNAQYRFPIVTPIILHHGTHEFTGSTQVRRLFPNISGFVRYLISFRAILIDLNRIPMEQLPTDPNVPRLNIVLKIMKIILLDDNSQDAERCFREIQPYIGNSPEDRDFAQLVIRYFIDGSHLEGDWLKEKVLEYFPEEIGETDMLTPREQYIEKGRQEGLSQGKYLAIINILNARFGKVPSRLQKRIQELTDSIVLDSLTVHAATCDSLDDFKEYLP